MNSRVVSTLLLVTLSAISVGTVLAQSPHKGDRANKENKAHVEKRIQDGKLPRDMDEEERAQLMQQRQEMREGLEGLSEEERAELMQERREEMHERRAEGGDNDPALRGSERAEEMRARRDERKAVKEEYRAGRQPGQEGLDDDDMDTEGGKPEKAKKLWGD